MANGAGKPKPAFFIAVLVVIALVLISLSKRLEAYASRWRDEVAL